MDVLGLFYFPTWLFYILAVITLYIIYMTWEFNFFKKRNIPYDTPYPVLGTLASTFKDGFVKNQNGMYERYKKHGIFGELPMESPEGIIARVVYAKSYSTEVSFEGRVPIFYFCAPKDIKEITVKKFNDFVNRRVIEGFNDAKPMDKMLTVLKDDHWKYVRNTLTPTFSGRKLRRMVSLINEAADSLMKSLDAKVKNNEDIEIKGHLGAFTMDTISSTAFGIKVDTQNDPDSPFVASAKKFFDISFTSVFFLIFFFFPFLSRFVTLFTGRKNKEMSAVFIDATKENIKFRKENTSNKYVDSLQLMLDTQKENVVVDNEEDDDKMDKTDNTENGEVQLSSTWTRKTGLTDEEILSQAVLFFVAAYETTANTLTFTLYNLALNPECCDKLYEEIDAMLGESNPTYDNINQLTYLEMCINETLRLTPAAPRLERIASRDTEIAGVSIPKDSVIVIPIGSLQLDEQYWPNPNQYDPERFTAENKVKRDPYTYMPFGMGPRNCIGMRLALLEAKIALARIIQKYKPVRCDKTKVPLELPKIGNLAPKEGVWIKLEARKEE